MMVFFCGNTYKNTLQNVTANRRIFFEFSNENPEKNGKNEMNIRGIFLCLPVQQSPEKCTDI